MQLLMYLGCVASAKTGWGLIQLMCTLVQLCTDVGGSLEDSEFLNLILLDFTRTYMGLKGKMILKHQHDLCPRVVLLKHNVLHFFIHRFSHIIYPDYSSLSTQSFLVPPLLQIHSLYISLQKKLDLHEATTKLDKTKYCKKRQKPLYQGWPRQLERMTRVPRNRDTPLRWLWF